MEENRRLALERKRKKQESLGSEPQTEQKGIKKLKLEDPLSVDKSKEMKGEYPGMREEEELLDLKEDDLGDYLEDIEMISSQMNEGFNKAMIDDDYDPYN